MKTFLRKLVKSVKRNPVILAFLVAVATQVFQDYQANAINWAHFWGYLAMVCISVVARGLVVPVKDHEEMKQEANEALAYIALKSKSDGGKFR